MDNPTPVPLKPDVELDKIVYAVMIQIFLLPKNQAHIQHLLDECPGLHVVTTVDQTNKKTFLNSLFGVLKPSEKKAPNVVQAALTKHPEMAEMINGVWAQYLEVNEKNSAASAADTAKPVEQVKEPGLFKKAINLMGAAHRTATAAVKGEQVIVPEEEQDRRLAICQKCEFFDSKKGMCKICGCYLKWKKRLAKENCPKGLW